MSNHFHLLLETPEPNLVSGMKWLLGGFSQAWNRRYKRRGHVFQGRYKSIPVSGECATDPYHFRIVADYIHLNPSRAKIVGGTKGALIDYRWSSLPAYSKGKGPEWLGIGQLYALCFQRMRETTQRDLSLMKFTRYLSHYPSSVIQISEWLAQGAPATANTCISLREYCCYDKRKRQNFHQKKDTIA